MDIDESRIPHGDAGDADATTYAGIACGSAFCAPPVEVCCAATYGDTDHRNGSCTQRNTCPTGDYFACLDERDCAYTGSAGPYCCIERLKGGAWTKSACQSDCGSQDTLCSKSSSGCPAERACQASLELPELFQCAAP